ncbi:hypothetical protein Tco_0522713 [Tanacetum coccineum]
MSSIYRSARYYRNVKEEPIAPYDLRNGLCWGGNGSVWRLFWTNVFFSEEDDVASSSSDISIADVSVAFASLTKIYALVMVAEGTADGMGSLRFAFYRDLSF